jgi:hypothetical protein
MNVNLKARVANAFIAEPALKPVAGVTQYVTCVRYSPKDINNRIESNQTSLAIFLSGKVNQFLPGVPEICAGLAYQRFPEAEQP